MHGYLCISIYLIWKRRSMRALFPQATKSVAEQGKGVIYEPSFVMLSATKIVLWLCVERMRHAPGACALRRYTSVQVYHGQWCRGTKFVVPYVMKQQVHGATYMLQVLDTQLPGSHSCRIKFYTSGVLPPLTPQPSLSQTDAMIHDIEPAREHEI